MPPKRKRSGAPDGGRPSPHRPGDTSLGQHDREDGGGRSRGRGNQRGGYNRRDSSQHSHRGSRNQSQNGSPIMGRSTLPPQAVSPTMGRSNSTSQSMPPPPTSPPPSLSLGQPVMKTPAQSSTPTPATESTADPSTAKASPVEYRYNTLTDEILREWTERGRTEVIGHGCQSREDEDITELSSVFQEFIHSVITGRLDPTDAGACVKEILGGQPSEETADADSFANHSLFLDSLSIILEIGANEYQPSLADFLKSTGIPVSLMRQVLEGPVLTQLGLVRGIFQRTLVRHTTNLLYRQSNFNLLREETEGYSKLITELYTTSDVLPVDMAMQTFEKIKGLIGTFDLDVGRVLDVTLDVAAAVLVKQFRFFVKLLRVSSWWPRSHLKATDTEFIGGLPTWATPGYPDWNTTEEDEAKNAQSKLARDIAFWDRAREVQLQAFFELGGRRPSPSSERDLASTNGDSGEEAVLDSQMEWLKATKTMPPVGNRVAAQLLGFKLLFYYSDTRDTSDVLPANLLYLAALLIKIGFISLADIWPHLSPADDNMDKVRDQKLKEMEEKERKVRGGGQMNALLMAGALPQDDDGPPSAPARRDAKRPEAEPKPDPKKANDPKSDDPHEQKVTLLTQLLTIGAIPEALFILGRFPWIPETVPDVIDGIHRILHVSLEKVYSDSCPIKAISTDCPTKRVPDPDQGGVPKGTVKLTSLTTKKILRWPTPDKNDHNETQDYHYYWDEWTDNVPVCQSVDDVFTLCDTLLNLSGVNIGKDEALLSKLATIGSKSLHDDSSEQNLNRWQSLLRRLLVPALSHTKANGSAVNAVWALLKHYPIQTRYSIYSEWFEGQVSRIPAMQKAFVRAKSETQATMKRVSLTNLGEMAKRLAKTSLSSPGIVFRVAFEQLESYPNLIEAFVECAKYFTELSQEVLVWSLVNSLGKSRSRTQADHALTTSKWLSALSRFTGRVFRRYATLSPTPVLQYMNKQLSQGNSTDLIILKELISSMGGIVDTADFTDYQILSMAGGEVLRRYTLIRGQDRRFDNVRSSQRLVKALTESKLAGLVLVNLAQFRQAAIFQVPEDEAHIKYLSSLIDDTHQILIQYLDFLWTNLDATSYEAAVPLIPQLMSSFGLDASLSFLIGRASFSSKMFPPVPKRSAEGKATEKGPEVDKDGDAKMAEPTGTSKQDSSPKEKDKAALEEEKRIADSAQIQAMLQPTVEAARENLSTDVWEKFTPELYVTFWALQLGDIFCPDKSYKAEITRVKNEELALSRDRSSMNHKNQERKYEKRKELMNLSIDLQEEQNARIQRRTRFRWYLTRQFQTSFPEPRPTAESIADLLLEQCFLPRLVLSPADAEYTYRFIKSLHEWNAPGFKLMALYDRLFNANRLRSIIFSCTVREADQLGRFLKLILEDLSRWHKNDPIPGDRDRQRLGAYEKEGKGQGDQAHLGFALTVDDNGRPETFVEHAEFQGHLFRWHKNLNTALKSCLGGTEWMHIRNAITVLKCVLDFFPAIDFMATQFSSQLQKITKQEAASKTASEGEEAHRVDLSVAAQGALSELQKRKSKWIMVQAFRPNSVGGAQTDGDKPSLRPTATEFKPNTPSASVQQTTAEAEDGEVQDGKPKSRVVSSSNNETASNDSLPPKPSGPSRDTARREATPSAPAPRAPAPKNDPRVNLPSHPPPNLPSRPDVPIPGHYSERYNQSRTHDRRETRDTRESWNSRETRENRDPRDTRDAKEHHDPRNNWPKDVEFHDRGREHTDRRQHEGREAHRPENPPRNGQERDRPPRESRGAKNQDEPKKDAAAPSKPESSSATQEPAMNPERAALFRQDKKDWTPRRSETEQSARNRRQPHGEAALDNINPERAALIGDNADGTPKQQPREDGRERAARGHSDRHTPRHGHDNPPPTEPAHEERPVRPFPQDHRVSSGRDPRDRSPHPSSYRGERPLDRPGGDRGAIEKNRDASGFHRPGSRGQEHEHRGPAFEEPNYGRLNPVEAVNDAPSGPRGRGRSAARGGHPNAGLPPSRPDNRYSHDTPERHPPTGPSSSGRPNRRGYDSHGGPQTPSNGPMHNDRMRNFSAGPEMGSPATGVHPDRLAQMGPGSNSHPAPPPPPPPPPGGPPPHGRHSMGSNMTPDRSRSDQRSSNNINNNMNVTPVSEGGARGGSRRQLAGINNMLQASKPEPTRSSSSRGSRPRPMLANSDVQVLTGGSPAATPTQERPDPVRHESSHKAPTNGDEAAPREEHDRSRRDREPRSDRPSRSSRRSSRDRDHERSATRDKDSKEHREYRERRSGAGQESNREERESRRPGRVASGKDFMPPPSGGREVMGVRESRHRGDGSASRGPPREGGGSRPDERRESSGRKRRGDDGAGSMGNDREKRPRR
ncbi:unnamed protein product [Clonostachys solani]|uniref:THO complex subunit 2 n=1 Tax=Clonostachys solani TaxID=160281 RepID=A0A9N9ZG02_9HYPO|nr:unnamed protein product [Clonostachys solani]